MEATEFLLSEKGLQVLRAGVLMILGLIMAKIGSVITRRLSEPYLEPQQTALLRRVVFYGIVILTLMSALHQLGFSLTVILGAAGILSVALGFASQTSASNLISGLFLIGEKPFRIGDVIRVGETLGEVLSIDLLSVKLRTFDNLYVRVPNETLIKSEIVNLTRFSIRRLELKVGVAYKEDLARVREVLLNVADEYNLCLTEPKPNVLFLGFGDSSLDLQFNVWATRENFLELRNNIPEKVRNAFDEAGIEIPFPHRTLYTGSVTDPFPIRLVGGDSDRPPAEGEGGS
ncbi:mechanosensitive ion channel family protein [Natronospira bacteriovora]|uniref:Small-conductance mechanosensitive channel n=1 Tax=Natronospira bacteriovora TaxID=3069753 RepID=A0ABU0W9S4_9GAMM|nr:mechanosensitive ion channel family protein [Natronospira sp. AB-CW4]MDQ2070775.1 mechanosensitive ion channel family protein [Natronospira sp. AB-CW4]